MIKKNQIRNYSYDNTYQYFDYNNLSNISIILKGLKQVQNSAICIECMKILNDLGFVVTENSIRNGLKTVVHRARMEIINTDPLMIFDGAHNEPAIENFLNSINMYYSNSERVYIISILKRKNYKKMIKILMKDVNALFIFTYGNDINKYVSSEELYNIALEYKSNHKILKMCLDEAIKFVIDKHKNNSIFFIGSFYTYGHILETISKYKYI